MSDKEFKRDPKPAADKSGEDRLRGKDLVGSDQKRAVDHSQREKSVDPDAVLHLDNEKDSLYADGLDLDEDSDFLAGTDGNSANPNKG